MSALPLWVKDKAGEPRVYVRTPFELKEAVKAAAGARWDGDERAWHVPATPAGAAGLVERLIGHSLALDEATDALLQEHAKERGAMMHKTAEVLPEIPGTLPAWLHQKRAYHWAVERRASMLAMDMGTGKSRVAISLLDGWGSELAIIVCPSSVMNVWPNQFATHSGRNWLVAVPPQRATVLKRAGFLGRRVEQARIARRPVCLVVNYEAAPLEVMKDLLLELRKQGAMMILDESHRIKAPGGKQSVFMSKLRAAGNGHVLALTGTPMPHSPMDLYGQFRAIDPGVFGTSFNRFRNRYAVMGGFEGRQVIDYQNEEELAAKLGANAFVVKKDEAGLNLPPVVHDQRYFSLGVKSQKAYDTLEHDFILAIGGEVGQSAVTVDNALTKLLRLQQVTSGYLRDDDGLDHEIGDDKVKVLEAILEDLPHGEPIVVFARFKHDLARIRALVEKLGRRYGEVSGACKPGHEDYGLNEHSQMRDDIDVICLQIQSGGVGIDLTRACYCIYYSLDFSLGNYDQTLARCDRPGQKRSVTYFHLIAKDTKDEVVYKALAERRDVVEAVIESSRTDEAEAA